MNYGKGLAFCCVSLIAIGNAASPLHAGTPREPILIVPAFDVVERRISYADLNLAAATGERTLNQRIGRAVTSLCNETVGGTRTSREFRDCKSQAWRSVRPQVSLAAQRAHEIVGSGSSMTVTNAITIAMPK